MTDEMSEGERHKVALAQVLIKEPRIVIMDEPTGTTEPITKLSVTNSILKDREEIGETFIIVSHDMDFVNEICDHVALMRDGKIVDTGKPEHVLSISLLKRKKLKLLPSKLKQFKSKIKQFQVRYNFYSEGRFTFFI